MSIPHLPKDAKLLMVRIIMFSSQDWGYIPVNGTKLLNPIISLLEILEESNPTGPNEVQASIIENSYSISISCLSVLMIESIICRAQYLHRASQPKLLKPLEFVARVYPDCKLLDDLEELFVLRDVIAHNHLWEARIKWSEDGMKFADPPPSLLPGYGDTKFQKVLDLSSRKSRRLGVNLFPARICRDDAVIVLEKATEFLRFLEQRDLNVTGTLDNDYVKFQGALIPFADVIASLRK